MTSPTCCGQRGAFAAAGGPLAPGCVLCPDSPTHWRRAENRDDGQPYREPTLDEAYASLNQPRRRR